MKKLALAAMLLMSASAFADHSLLTAMNDQPKIDNAVSALVTGRNVFCALDQSMQMSPTVQWTDGGDVWRQVAFCFASKSEADAFAAKASDFGGIYGVPAVAILDVTYNLQTGKIFELSLR